jgi:hypothetical protein
VHALPSVAGDRERWDVRHEAEDFLVFAHSPDAIWSALNTSCVSSLVRVAGESRRPAGVLKAAATVRAGHGLSPDRNLSVKSQPRDRFPLLGRGAILGRL